MIDTRPFKDIINSFRAMYKISSDGKISMTEADEAYASLHPSTPSAMLRIKEYFSVFHKIDSLCYFEILHSHAGKTLWMVNGVIDYPVLRLVGNLVSVIGNNSLLPNRDIYYLSAVGTIDCRDTSNIRFIRSNNMLSNLMSSGLISSEAIIQSPQCKNAIEYKSASCGKLLYVTRDRHIRRYILECIPVLSEERAYYLFALITRTDDSLITKNDVSAKLTPRENEILTLASEGLTNRYIANALGISEGTVKKSLYNSYKKLNISSRYDIIRLI